MGGELLSPKDTSSPSWGCCRVSPFLQSLASAARGPGSPMRSDSETGKPRSRHRMRWIKTNTCQRGGRRGGHKREVGADRGGGGDKGERGWTLANPGWFSSYAWPWCCKRRKRELAGYVASLRQRKRELAGHGASLRQRQQHERRVCALEDPQTIGQIRWSCWICFLTLTTDRIRSP